MKYEKILTAIETIYWLIELIKKGDRDGWGYDIKSLDITLAALDNERKMKFEEYKKGEICK